MEQEGLSVDDSPKECYRRRMGLGHDHDLRHSNHGLTICSAGSADCTSGNLDLQREMLWAIRNVAIRSGDRMLTAEEEVEVHLNEHGAGTRRCSIRWRPCFVILMHDGNQ